MGCFLSKTSTDARDDRSYLHAPLPHQSIDPIESSSSSDKENRSHAPAHLSHHSPFLDPIESSLSSDEENQIHSPAQSLVIDPIDEEENQNPEYGDIQRVSEKSDVYSFGVVLLELITGRKPLDNGGDTIINWAKDRIGQALENNEYTDLVDSRLRDYLCPEYFRTQQISDKTDVYSFGVVLLELITGKRPISREGNFQALTSWVAVQLKEALDTDNYDNIVDVKLKNNYRKIEMIRMIHCAAACVYKPAKYRPKMSQIAEVLQGNLALESIWLSIDNTFLKDEYELY
ncbi:hypothetical protein GH714_021388 [Hevea brasiliensis]|uniref:non-specific serine/threonine protein kinase n=1 Tax=Hevea brasiliensis TaxID=3981 RepID=A0A6A6LL34_HEVBR|nr:hypothetical protein GH714_021388 [Hevea brasiliensis]